MNIGIVTTWFPAGAGYVSNAYKDILEKNHTIHIYARSGKIMKGDTSWDLPNVTWAPKHYLTTGVWESHFLRWIRKNKIEVILFNEQRFWRPVITAKKAGVHVGAYVDYYTQMTVPLFYLYDFLFCNTKRHFSVFDKHKNAYYIPWGVDLEKFRPSKVKMTRPVTFLVSSGWETPRGLDRRGSLLALSAFKTVTGPCRMIIYSQVESKEKMSEWTSEYENDKRIEFRFGTFEPFPFSEGDIYVYPSRLDGIGLSLPEALASGLPAITTNSSPMNEFVENNYNGFTVDVEKYLGRFDGYYWPESICSIQSLSAAMQQYIDFPDLIKTHSLNARNYACQKLSWSGNADHIVDYIASSLLNPVCLDKKLVKKARSVDHIISPTITYRILKLVYDLMIFLKEKVVLSLIG